jgi:hypothetical protein
MLWSVDYHRLFNPCRRQRFRVNMPPASRKPSRHSTRFIVAKVCDLRPSTLDYLNRSAAKSDEVKLVSAFPERGSPSARPLVATSRRLQKRGDKFCLRLSLLRSGSAKPRRIYPARGTRGLQPERETGFALLDGVVSDCVIESRTAQGYFPHEPVLSRSLISRTGFSKWPW